MTCIISKHLNKISKNWEAVLNLLSNNFKVNLKKIVSTLQL